jgi:hypothetical protein
MARFCPICGAALAAPSPPPDTNAKPSGAAPAAPIAPVGFGSKRTALFIGGGLLALAIAGFLFARASGILGTPSPRTPAAGVLSAPPTQTAQAPVLAPPAVDAPQAPVLTPPQTQGIPMPDDVVEYLRWLKWFEGERRKLEAECASQLTLALQELIKDYTTGASLGLLDAEPGDSGATPAPRASHSVAIAQVIQKWNQATAVFQQKTPPDPCAGLATTYGQALAAGVQQMGTLQGILNTAQESIKGANGQSTGDAQSALTELFQQKNTKGMSKSVDTLYTEANGGLDTVRNAYTSLPADIDRAHFDIRSEGGSMALPSILGL